MEYSSIKVSDLEEGDKLIYFLTEKGEWVNPFPKKKNKSGDIYVEAGISYICLYKYLEEMRLSKY